MDKKTLSLARKNLRANNATFPSEMTSVPSAFWPEDSPPTMTALWRSKSYLAQVHEEDQGVKRLSICKAALLPDGRVRNDLTWKQLQAIKSEMGFGDSMAVEVFPRDKDKMDIGNMRHLWIAPFKLGLGWSPEPEEPSVIITPPGFQK